MTEAASENLPPPLDVATLLETEHQALREMFVSLEAAPRELVGVEFSKLIAELVRHESAEEVEIYSALGSADADERAADDRLPDHSAIERRLAALDKVDPGSPEFIEELELLRTDFSKHVAAEELHLLPVLSSMPSESRLALAERYLAAKDQAPARQHPHKPDSLQSGPVDAMTAVVDRIRDSGGGRT